MADPVITNVTLHPQDGWVQLSAGVTAFLRVSKFPDHVPVFLYAGSSAPTVDPVQATGTFVFATGVPTAGQSVHIGTETYTFVTLRAAPFQVTIGGTALLTATAFTAAVNSDSALVSAADVSGTVTVTAKAAGPVGNYATTSGATDVTAGGATMTGGANAQAGYRWACHTTHFDSATIDKLWGRIIQTSNDNVYVSIWSQ
jgi:hypothetical protein